MSNHASGTAIDLNAPAHPLGTQPTANFSASQIRKIKKIVADCGGVVRWGGSYSGRKDGMHFEINTGSANVKKLAKLIKAGKVANAGSLTGSGAKSSGGSTTYKSVSYGALLKKYTKGEPVKDVQRFFGLKADGYYGANTATAVGKWQKAHKLTADKIVGPKTWSAMKKAGLKSSQKKASAKKSTAPAFPLPAGHYYGVESRSSSCHSGYYAKDRPAIKRVQKALKVKADGIWGAKTRSAFGKWQSKAGLKKDYECGVKSWNRMRKYL